MTRRVETLQVTFDDIVLVPVLLALAKPVKHGCKCLDSPLCRQI